MGGARAELSHDTPLLPCCALLPAMLLCRVALCEARSELAAAGDSFVKLEAIHRSGNAQGGIRRLVGSRRGV